MPTAGERLVSAMHLAHLHDEAGEPSIPEHYSRLSNALIAAATLQQLAFNTTDDCTAEVVSAVRHLDRARRPLFGFACNRSVRLKEACATLGDVGGWSFVGAERFVRRVIAAVGQPSRRDEHQFSESWAATAKKIRAITTEMIDGLATVELLDHECRRVLGVPSHVTNRPLPQQGDYSKDDGPIPAAKSIHDRPTAARNAIFLRWKLAEGMGPAAIRDRWNGMTHEQRREVGPRAVENVTREVVKKALASAVTAEADLKSSEFQRFTGEFPAFPSLTVPPSRPQ